MAEAEEPQFTSLQARIAALNQSQVGGQHQTFGKRPPPPLPTSKPRPSLNPRGQTTNNPPIVTYGSSVTKQSNNQPLGVKTVKANLPPPPIDRDSLPSNSNPTLPVRNAPPPLPSRKVSQPSPALPPRKDSTQMVRRGSNSSTISFSSTISGVSSGQVSTTSSTDTHRKLPPPLSQTTLPPLPPTRRQLEEKTNREEQAKLAKIPLISIRSAPDIRDESDIPPKMPPRPNDPLRRLTRPPSRGDLQEETPPAQPPRRVPPASTRPNILSMGFNNKKETPNPGPTPAPAPTHSRPMPQAIAKQIGSVRELSAQNFDSVVMTGTPVFVDFYAPYCKYCKELDPIWEELADNFSFTDKVIIAKVNISEHESFLSRYDIKGYPTLLFFNGHSNTPEKYAYMRELEPLIDFLEEKTRISAAGSTPVAPPIINISSKPSLAQIKAVQSRPPPPAPSGCLRCRDFSGPDHVASQYPRQSLIRGDTISYLADVLCGPFPSLTDKARAIFTWLHHNIAYDTVAFFGNNVKHMDPKDTVASGLAVCGGYAGLFVAIALKAGMESVMVTGHGKGYGYSPLKPGESVPPCDPSGHAWNAVRIDGGGWKLLDACWGAGYLGNQVYNKKFTPSYFTMSNDEFGLKHFPSDNSHFFRSDGRVLTWEEYVVGIGAEPLQLYGLVEDQGLSPTSFTPPQKHISVRSNEVVRFQFSKVCEHWDSEKHGAGKPFFMILKINGLDGRKSDFVAFENNEYWWWADVNARDLGASGQEVCVYTVETVNGKDARGLSRREYLGKKGKCAMSFGGICAWELM